MYISIERGNGYTRVSKKGSLSFSLLLKFREIILEWFEYMEELVDGVGAWFLQKQLQP